VKVFFDSEFTGLHKDTGIISLGMVSDNGKEFYAEFSDFDPSQVDDWIKDNVIAHLQLQGHDRFFNKIGSFTVVKGTKADVLPFLDDWMAQFDKVELWSDVQHYDVVLLFDLWGHAFSVPDHIYYIPFDISAYFKFLGLDPDTDREAFIDRPIEGKKHNSLYDAKVIQACYDKLQRNKENYLKKLV